MTTASDGRRRAPGMSPDDRRAMIVAVALPLVAEHGTAISTAQVAKAAGIGEATLFRAFGDKEALIDACLAQALRPDTVLDGLASISLDAPVAERLVDAVEELDAHLTRMGSVIRALHSTGRRAGRPAPGEDGAPAPDARAESTCRMVAAVAELLEPDAAQLRWSPEQLAAVFLNQQFAGRRTAVGSALTPRESVELFLHGAVQV